MVKDPLNELDNLTKQNIALALWMKEFKAKKVPKNVRKHILSNKNSPESFGKRMLHRIQELLDNPDSFTPSYRKRYEKLLEHCNLLTPLQAYAMNHLLGTDSSRGYQKIPDESNIEFPGILPRNSDTRWAGTSLWGTAVIPEEENTEFWFHFIVTHSYPQKRHMGSV
jgi:hypothetical protein